MKNPRRVVKQIVTAENVYMELLSCGHLGRVYPLRKGTNVPGQAPSRDCTDCMLTERLRRERS